MSIRKHRITVIRDGSQSFLSSGGCRFKPDGRRVIIKEFLILVLVNGIRTGDPREFNKGVCSKFCVGSRVRQTPEESRWIYRPNRCEYNNKDEANSPKTLNDKNHQASSQKFRQLRDFDCLLIIEEILAKNLNTTLLLEDFSKSFDSKHKEKMELILVYGFPKESQTAMSFLKKYKGNGSLTLWQHRLHQHCR